MAAQRAMTETARAWHAKLAEDFAERATASTTAAPLLPSARKAPSPPNLASIGISSAPPRPVEDWEQFFVEKSRRRSERVRSERRRKRAILAIIATVLGLLFAGAIAGLANLT